MPLVPIAHYQCILHPPTNTYQILITLNQFEKPIHPLPINSIEEFTAAICMIQQPNCLFDSSTGNIVLWR